MNINFLILCLFGLVLYSFFFGRNRARKLSAHSDLKQHSRDIYHGMYMFICVGLPPLILILLWGGFAPFIINQMLHNALGTALPEASTAQLNIFLAQTKSLHAGILSPDFVADAVKQAAIYYQQLLDYSNFLRAILAALLAGVGFFLGQKFIAPRFVARQKVERVADWVMVGAATVAILTTIGIILSLIFETMRFFENVSLREFLFGIQWSPQIAIHGEQAGGSGSFGAVPIFAGTLMITFIAMLVAVPIGLMSAVYLSEYARPRLRAFAKPAIEVLAGVPTVVYGFFAALVVAPMLRDGGTQIGINLSSESALAAGLVMGIMIIPFVSSLSDDVINAVPQNLRDGASALGATQSETIKKVVLPAALPGIVSAVLLAVSRAIGETMIVVMAAGVAANLTANPFESVTTVTVQIVMLLVGDQEFDSAKTLAAFALGLVLFCITLGLNILALHIVNKYREVYE